MNRSVHMEQDSDIVDVLFRVRQALEDFKDLKTYSSNYTEPRQGVYAEVGNLKEFFPGRTNPKTLHAQISQFRGRIAKTAIKRSRN